MNEANNFKITLFPVNDWTRKISWATNECLDIYQLNWKKNQGVKNMSVKNGKVSIEINYL